MARAYLDHASSSPLRPAALEAMLPVPRASTTPIPAGCTPKGTCTRVAVEEAREQVADSFGAAPA